MAKRMGRARTAVCLAVLCLLTLGLAPAGNSAALAEPSLSISPTAYVGGQRVTFQGNLGVTGEQTIRLQFHMGRPGDSWTDVGFTTQTQADGSFQFTHPAPSMFNIMMRLTSGEAATPAYTFYAKSQDLILTVPNEVSLGKSFTVGVDATPKLYRRPDLLGTPAFPGRVLTLQQQVGDEWVALDPTSTSTTDSQGHGSLSVSASQLNTAVGRDYPLVLRVRQEDVTGNGNKIGWFPSFPTRVQVQGVPSSLVARQLPDDEAPTTTLTPTKTTSPTGPALPRLTGGTAGQSRGWRPALWDFAWEYGESLTSPPRRGTDPVGWWLDSTTGAGRASKHNGGLMLDSQRNYEGPGDFGTTSATLRGNPRTYGRWEAKMRLKRNESGRGNYHALIQLVRDGATNNPCGAITVADVPVSGSTVGIGARSLSGDQQWTATRQFTIGTGAAAFAVEVSKDHISWFINGRVVGTVRNEAAVPDVPMTLRLSLVGEGQKEMNKAQFISDWQRGYDIGRGSLTFSDLGLKRGTHSGGC